jgi:2-keto-4-pentenoate hydratase
LDQAVGALQIGLHAVKQAFGDVLAAFGERLGAGEIIITGSVVPPLTIEPGEDAITFEVDPIARVAVRFE